MDLSELPTIVLEAWKSYGDPRSILGCEETSPGVSTNRVFRLDLGLDRGVAGERAGSVFVKLSSYGSYVHFRQDHARIARWITLLAGTRYAALLAPVLGNDGSVFTHEDNGSWVVFYGEVARRSPTPPVLRESDITQLAQEIARLHLCCDQLRSELDPTWKTLGSDVAILYDELSEPVFCRERGFSRSEVRSLKQHCDLFLENAELLGYHRMHRLPVLIDWNRGNFSVQYSDEGFTLFSRWDYDWFRIEPRTLDFYFLSRVARAEGDRTTFSYLVDPLLEPRFSLFLSTYHEVFPLTERELLFMREAYRFFILNYVIRVGEHFFVPEMYRRLTREAVEVYLPSIERADFAALERGLE